MVAHFRRGAIVGISRGMQSRARLLPRGGVVGLAVTVLLVGVAPTGQAGKPAPPPTTGCSTPATDACTDYVFRGRRWSGPIAYYVNPAGAPQGFSEDVQDAFVAWENELKSPAVEASYPGDRSNLDFVYLGTTTATGARDGRNVVYLSATSGSAGVSLTTKGSRITEFDMVMNSTWSWSTDITCPAHDCGTVDVQNVVTHEVGHVIDLYHVTAEANSLQTMYSQPADPSKRSTNDWRDETVKRDLGAGEVLAVRKAYPSS